LEAEVGVSSSRPSCDVEATLPEADSLKQKTEKNWCSCNSEFKAWPEYVSFGLS